MKRPVPAPTDPRLAPFIALREAMPLVEFDREERDERKLAERIGRGK